MNRRRVLALLLVLTTAFTVGCGKTKSNNTNTKTDTKTETEEEQPKEVAADDYWNLSIQQLQIRAYEDDAMAAYVLGTMYDLGLEKASQNFNDALTWYTMASQLGNAQASLQLGYMYMNGAGVEVDYDQANTWFNQAIAQGSSGGYAGLARVLMAQDQDANAQAIYDNASQAYAADDMDGLLLMAYLQSHGIGCEVNVPSAKDIYTKLAAMEVKDPVYQYNINESNVQLALITVNNPEEGAEPDYTAAIDYLKLADKNAYAKASFYLGVIYENGLGVDQSYDEAMTYFKSAADQEYAPSLNQIGYLYFNGLGVDTNMEQAVYYEKLSATQGYAMSQVNLGYMYENGYGVGQDYSTALAYYQMAADQGFSGGSEAVARIQNLMVEQSLVE